MEVLINGVRYVPEPRAVKQSAVTAPSSSDVFKLGVGLFVTDMEYVCLQKLDDVEDVEESYGIKIVNRYDADEDAVAAVKSAAIAGDDICRRIIEFLIHHNSPDVAEYNLVNTWSGERSSSCKEVTVELKFRVTLDVAETKEVSDVINEMDYRFVASDGATVVDTELLDYEVADSE